ncbi:unnamed protein product [Cochlearia groenlandica]
MDDPMEEIRFSATEMAAAEQLSEEETVSFSGSTGGDNGGEGRGRKRKHREDVSSRIENDVVKENYCNNNNNNIGVKKMMKEKKFRSLESIYRETNEI